MDDFEVRCGDLLYGQSSTYLVECFLGEGSFGKVARCLKTATQEKVAVKIIKNQPHHIDDALQEMTILQRIQRLDNDRCAIVRWTGWFESGPHFCLEFELLHMSLRDFLNRRETLTLDDMYNVLYQLAAALALLELFGVIHADLKPDNIMLVDDLRPLKVKIIDFGLACHISQVQVGANAGTRWYKAPELLLGLPYTGAIDVWALGCVAVEMFTGYPVYPGCSEYQMLKYISETQGPFPDHMLDVGINTKLFFNEGWFWTLKSTGQYCRETGVRDVENRWYRLNSLDELAQVDAGDEVQNFVDLLKGMLQLDAGLRITPKGIAKHPICISPCHGNAEHADTSQDGSSCLDMVTSLSPYRSLVSEEQILSSQSECNSSGSRDVSTSRDMVTSLSPSSSLLFSSNSTEQSRLQQQESCSETSSSSSNMAAPEVTSDHSEALKPAADVHKAGKRSKVKGFFVKLLKTLCCCCFPTDDDV